MGAPTIRRLKREARSERSGRAGRPVVSSRIRVSDCACFMPTVSGGSHQGPVKMPRRRLKKSSRGMRRARDAHETEPREPQGPMRNSRHEEPPRGRQGFVDPHAGGRDPCARSGGDDRPRAGVAEPAGRHIPVFAGGRHRGCRGRSGQRIIASFLSFVGLNFFFTEPHHTLAVREATDVVALIAFLLSGLIVGGLVSRVREERARAERRATESQLLSKTTEQFISRAPLSLILDGLAEALLRLFDLIRCEIATPDGMGRRRPAIPTRSTVIRSRSRS